MRIASSETIRKRLAAKRTRSYDRPKDFLKNNVSAPRRLKYNAGDGGEYARTYMVDHAAS